MSYQDLFGNPIAKITAAPIVEQKVAPVKEAVPFNATASIIQAPIAQNDVAIYNGPTLAVQQKFSLACQARNESDISDFGTQAGKEVAALADTILQKTTTGKMGDFGDGITQILSLTSQVNPDDLNVEKGKGIIGSVTSFFKKKRVEVLANFENTSKSIQKIADDLIARQVVMKQDNLFLDKLYEKNMQEYHELGESIEAAQEYLDQSLTPEYESKKSLASQTTDQFEIQAINELEQKIKRWEKQIDRLKRMQQVALLTAPEIRMIQSGNVTMVEKFNDLMNTTLPAWKKQISMTILALRQRENADLGNKVDDQTNAFFLKASQLNKDNAIAVAKTAERSTVDISTLETMQKNLIESVKQVKEIQEQGRTDRKNASDKIDQLRSEMKQEMLSWSRA